MSLTFTVTMTGLRLAATNIFVALGGIAYLIAFVSMVMGDDARVWAFQLAASCWLGAWGIKP